MELTINLEANKTTLELRNRGKTVDSIGFSYYHDLEQKLTLLEAAYLKRYGYVKEGKTRVYKELLTGLITNLDKLLRKNKIDMHSLKSYKIRGNLGSEATSHKIAEAFIEGLEV